MRVSRGGTSVGDLREGGGGGGESSWESHLLQGSHGEPPEDS